MKENSKKAGIHLLEKGKRGIFRVIFSRSGLILVLLAHAGAVPVQHLSLVRGLPAPHLRRRCNLHVFYGTVSAQQRYGPTAKITWLVVVMLLPVFGALLFLYTQKTLATGL